MENVGQTGTLYYFGDPMCSWCWGLKPVLEQVDREYPELSRITVMGGLRGETDQVMSDAMTERIQAAWARIEKNTGQPFNHEFWRENRPLATTIPACRAVVSARLLKPSQEWPFMVGMFRAYFTDARDPTRRETHCKVADDVGLDREAFSDMLANPAVDDALREDLRTTRRFGITGFPSVVLSLQDQNYLISPGYQPIDGIRRAINTVYEKVGIDFMRPENGIYS